LDENRGFARIESGRQIIEGDFDDVVAHLLRHAEIVGQCLSVGDHDVDLIIKTRIL
jgi:hypothetical protein